MTTAPTPSEKVQRLAITLEIVGAVPDMNYVTVPRHVARDASVELRRLQADNEAMRETLEFVERWAVHHASKPHMTAELALGSIQHHPEIRAITERYADSKRPDTFDPYARIAELEAKEEFKPDWAGFRQGREVGMAEMEEKLAAEARATAEHKLRADQLAQQHRMQAQMHAQATQQLAELEARKPLPLSDDDRMRLRSDVARAIWDVMREHEDRCDHALEDVEPKHQVWDCADAAIRAMKDKP